MAGESAAERHSRGVTAYEKRLRGLFDELVDGTAHLKGAERMGAIDEIVRSLFLANVDVFTAADADMFEEMTGLQAAMPATEDMAKKADALVNIVRSRVWKQVYEGDESFRDAAFGPIQRNLRDGGRNLAIRSAEKHGILWARVPKGKTCAWCQMVASQGFVYSSEEAAGKASKFHDNCDCMIVPDTAEGHKAVKRLGFDIEQARAEYEAAAKAMRADGRNRPKGHDGKPVGADWYMRRLQPGKYTDGVFSHKKRSWSEEFPGRRLSPKARVRSTHDTRELWERQLALKSDTFGERLDEQELEFIEKMESAGHVLQWIPRDSDGRYPSNDFIWLSHESEVCELKTTSTKYSTIKKRIVNAVKSAAEHEKAPITKDFFVVDLGRHALSSKLARQLSGFNDGRKRYRIRELWVMHSGGKLTRIELKE